MEFVYELKPQYDKAKSFYKKANVYRNNEGKLLLKSYDTIVASVKDKIVEPDPNKRVKVAGWYSNATARHINEFLQQNGFHKMSKKEMEGGNE